MELGHWTIDYKLLKETFDPTDFFGFVYKIIRVDTGRSYIGKKQLIFTRRIKVSGRKNRKHVKRESDWKTYTGSCKELNAEISTLGKDKFEFKILKFCETKRDLGYLETKIKLRIIESLNLKESLISLITSWLHSIFIKPKKALN